MYSFFLIHIFPSQKCPVLYMNHATYSSTIKLCLMKTLFSVIDYHLLLNFFVLQSTLLVFQERLTLRILELHRNSMLTELTIAHDVQTTIE